MFLKRLFWASPAGMKTIFKLHKGHLLFPAFAHKIIFLVFEQDIERGHATIAACNVLLEVQLVFIVEFSMGIDALFEHPQTVALILAHLDAQHTAAILKELDTSIGADVVFRMAKMEKVQPELLMLIERALSADTDLSAAQTMSSSGGPAAVASVLNYVAASLEKVLLDGVSSMDQSLCDQIKNLMFVFEDVGTLDAKALQRLLRDVDSKELALALKAASTDLRGKITGAMSQRAVSALNDEMEMLGAVRMRDVEGAQANIVAMVRKLEEAGEIVLAGGDDDMVQ